MADKKQKIIQKKKEGGQPNNKNAEKWTKQKALKLGQELVDWMLPKIESRENPKNRDQFIKVDIHATNIFYKEFLIIHKGLYEDLINYLAKKFKSFSDYIKRAESIQEVKLNKYGSVNKLNPAVTIFLLKHHHKYKDKQELSHSGSISDGSDTENKLRELFEKEGESKIEKLFELLKD